MSPVWACAGAGGEGGGLMTPGSAANHMNRRAIHAASIHSASVVRCVYSTISMALSVHHARQPFLYAETSVTPNHNRRTRTIPTLTMRNC